MNDPVNHLSHYTGTTTISKGDVIIVHVRNIKAEEYMTREEVLNAALRRVMAKPEEYGTPENVFGLIADLWGDYLSTKNGALELMPADVANMMILLKVARNTQGSKGDTWVDIAGYAACGAEVEV